jgi:hypothetical protein
LSSFSTTAGYMASISLLKLSFEDPRCNQPTIYMALLPFSFFFFFRFSPFLSFFLSFASFRFSALPFSLFSFCPCYSCDQRRTRLKRTKKHTNYRDGLGTTSIPEKGQVGRQDSNRTMGGRGTATRIQTHRHTLGHVQTRNLEHGINKAHTRHST